MGEGREEAAVTLPKTTCLPSRGGVGTVVMKNWLPLVLGPARGGRLATQFGNEEWAGAGAKHTSVGHGQQEGHVVLVFEVFVSELSAVDALACRQHTSVPVAANASPTTYLRFRCGW